MVIDNYYVVEKEMEKEILIMANFEGTGEVVYRTNSKDTIIGNLGKGKFLLIKGEESKYINVTHIKSSEKNIGEPLFQLSFKEISQSKHINDDKILVDNSFLYSISEEKKVTDYFDQLYIENELLLATIEVSNEAEDCSAKIYGYLDFNGNNVSDIFDNYFGGYYDAKKTDFAFVERIVREGLNKKALKQLDFKAELINSIGNNSKTIR